MTKTLAKLAAGAKPSLPIVVLTSVLCSVVTSVGMFYALSGGGGMAAIANTMCVAMLHTAAPAIACPCTHRQSLAPFVLLQVGRDRCRRRSHSHH